MLDLLEHGVGLPAGEGIAREKEHGDPVDQGRPGGGHHVERPRTDGAGHCEDLPAVGLLGEADGHVRSALLVVSLEIREGMPAPRQRLAEPDDIAVPDEPV